MNIRRWVRRKLRRLLRINFSVKTKERLARRYAYQMNDREVVIVWTEFTHNGCFMELMDLKAPARKFVLWANRSFEELRGQRVLVRYDPRPDGNLIPFFGFTYSTEPAAYLRPVVG